MISCFTCKKSKKKCVVKEGISRCVKCARRGFTRYNMGNPLPGDWRSLDKNKEKLEQELDKALAK
jgi:hypothetical protein